MKCSLLILSSFSDNELNARQKGEVEAHLVGCERCQRGLAHLEDETERIRDLARVHVPEDSAWLLFEAAGMNIDGRSGGAYELSVNGTGADSLPMWQGLESNDRVGGSSGSDLNAKLPAEEHMTPNVTVSSENLAIFEQPILPQSNPNPISDSDIPQFAGAVDLTGVVVNDRERSTVLPFPHGKVPPVSSRPDDDDDDPSPNGSKGSRTLWGSSHPDSNTSLPQVQTLGSNSDASSRYLSHDGADPPQELNDEELLIGSDHAGEFFLSVHKPENAEWNDTKDKSFPRTLRIVNDIWTVSQKTIVGVTRRLRVLNTLQGWVAVRVAMLRSRGKSTEMDLNIVSGYGVAHPAVVEHTRSDDDSNERDYQIETPMSPGGAVSHRVYYGPYEQPAPSYSLDNDEALDGSDGTFEIPIHIHESITEKIGHVQERVSLLWQRKIRGGAVPWLYHNTRVIRYNQLISAISVIALLLFIVGFATGKTNNTVNSQTSVLSNQIRLNTAASTQKSPASTPVAEHAVSLTGVITGGTGGSGYTVSSIQYGSHPGYLRTVFDLTSPPSDGVGSPKTVVGFINPTTMIVVLTGVTHATSIVAPTGGGGLITAATLIQPAPAPNEEVYKFTLSSPVTPTMFYMTNPLLLVIDLHPATTG